MKSKKFDIFNLSEIKKTFFLLISTLYISATLFGQSNDRNIEESETLSLLNKQMPTFSALDIQGRKYNSESFKNKIVFINFWFIDCPPCIQELKQLSDLYQATSKNPNIIFISITNNEKNDILSFLDNSDTLKIGGKIREHYRKFLTFDNKIKYPIICNPSKEIQKKFKMDRWPTSFIIDKNGIIRMINIGLKLDEPKNYLFEKYYQKINELGAE